MKAEHHHKDGEPLHNRVLELLLTNAILTIFVTFFAVLRLVVVYKNKKRWMLADWLLFVAIVSLPPLSMIPLWRVKSLRSASLPLPPVEQLREPYHKQRNIASSNVG